MSADLETYQTVTLRFSLVGRVPLDAEEIKAQVSIMLSEFEKLGYRPYLHEEKVTE